ncbi:MAG: cupin domain-containing protein [Pseudonocardia sp.]
MTRTNCTKWLIATAVAAAALLAGCAQPGELGSPPAAPPPAAVPAPSRPPPPAGPVLVGSGLIEGGVTIRNPRPATFSVRTVIVPPGGSTGWHQHPGPEMSIVKAGAITLLRGPDCAAAEYAAGDAVFIPGNTAHLARNDAGQDAELVVTYLLTPAAPERSAAPPACPGR